PELLEVVQHSAALEALLESCRQVFIRGVHVADLGRAQRLPVAMRDLDAVEHVRERDRPAVRHVRVPALTRVREADRLSVLDDVGQDHHFRDAGLLIRICDVDLQLPEAGAEICKVAPRQPLAWKPDNAVITQGPQHDLELAARQRLRKIEPLDRRAQSLPTRGYFHHLISRKTISSKIAAATDRSLLADLAHAPLVRWSERRILLQITYERIA